MNGKALVAGLAAGLLVAASAGAGTKYGANIVDLSPDNATNFHLLKPGKIGFKSTISPGGGGLVTSLNVANIDCPSAPEGNDGGAAGKCGPGADPVKNHVMELGVSVAGVLDLDSVAGILFNITKGKTTFVKTGKNSIGGGALGPAITGVFGKPLGIGVIKLRTATSNVANCNTTPLVAASPCFAGTVAYAVAGVLVGTDPSLTCATAVDCPKTQLCVSGICTTETCTVDGDCDQNGMGSGGTGQCNMDGDCCDPVLNPECVDDN